MSVITLGLGMRQVRPIKYFTATVTNTVQIDAAITRTFQLVAVIDKKASCP